MATPNRPQSDWIELLQTANTTRADKIPPGFLTRHEIAKATGKSLSTVDRTLPILLEEGKLERSFYRRLGNDGALRRIPHFRRKKGA